MKKIIPALLVFVAITALFAGCTKKDNILDYGRSSFTDIIKAYPGIMQDNTADNPYFDLSVDGETTLKISRDYQATGSGDILIETPLQPFIDAGLDPAKLTEEYKVQGDKFYLIGNYGNGSGPKDAVTDALFESVAFDRTTLTYHRDLDYCGISTRSQEDSFLNSIFGDRKLLEDPNGLDRFGIRVSQGKFEYAKDYVRNDKDIVFMIKAKPLFEIGVDVHNIKGWTFTTMEDLDCNDTDVLLKTYDLK